MGRPRWRRAIQCRFWRDSCRGDCHIPVASRQVFRALSPPCSTFTASIGQVDLLTVLRLINCTLKRCRDGIRTVRDRTAGAVTGASGESDGQALLPGALVTHGWPRGKSCIGSAHVEVSRRPLHAVE